MSQNVSIILQVLFFSVLCTVLVCYVAWFYAMSEKILEQWAKTNGYTLLHSEFAFFPRGRFLWTTSRCQTVYFVRIRDTNGRERTGWVRCGSFWSGPFKNETEVLWDDEL